jgi:CRP-like cAMP-binding protein
MDLSSVKLFAGLPQKELKTLEHDLNEVRQPAGKEIMITGHNGVGFLVILEGEAEVLVAAGHTHKLGPGDSFGEMAMLDEKGRSATVTALTDMKLVSVPHWEFKDFLTAHPEVAYRMLQTMSERLREAEQPR